MKKHELVLEEMRVLANDSEFAENEAEKCRARLREYLGLTNQFMALVRLFSLEQFIRDRKNISKAIDDFLSGLSQYQVDLFVLFDKKQLNRVFSSKANVFRLILRSGGGYFILI